MSDLPESPIGERFSAAVHNTARGWRLLIDKQLKHLGIGQAGWMTIAMIAKSGEPMSQRALADLVGVEGPSMVSMLDRLEREGLVTRAPSPTDRRVKLVHLTDAGTTLYKQVKEQANAVRLALLGDIDPARLEAATELLELLRARIEEQL
ncbi:MarR family winged helix-turn-helix transcriptional regulator [Massilia sp. 2TAF26]|uniref:MarR family winged helix-turn-helix transcriptional regulator n=1 Tax=Massilia sp. 2TAF26 TaxID=3233012 RepID=UPI003F986957